MTKRNYVFLDVEYDIEKDSFLNWVAFVDVPIYKRIEAKTKRGLIKKVKGEIVDYYYAIRKKATI